MIEATATLTADEADEREYLEALEVLRSADPADLELAWLIWDELSTGPPEAAGVA